MQIIIKPGYEYRTYNPVQTGVATYVQELSTPDGRVFKRSRGILPTDGAFSENAQNYFVKVCPEAFEPLGNFITHEYKRPHWRETLSPNYVPQYPGECWVHIFGGNAKRATRVANTTL